MVIQEKTIQETGELEQERLKRKEAEKELKKSKSRYERIVNTIPCAVYDYARWPDGRSRFIYISPQCKDIFEYDADQIMADPGLLWGMVYHEDYDFLVGVDLESNRTGNLFQVEVRIVLPSGKMKWIQLTSRPGAQKIDSQVVWSGVILDITDRKREEEIKNDLLEELKCALAEVKVLRGFLPICAECKKIRDDKGNWNQIESYIKKHSEAEFSHGICPDCVKKLYPELKMYEK